MKKNFNFIIMTSLLVGVSTEITTAMHVKVEAHETNQKINQAHEISGNNNGKNIADDYEIISSITSSTNSSRSSSPSQGNNITQADKDNAAIDKSLAKLKIQNPTFTDLQLNQKLLTTYQNTPNEQFTQTVKNRLDIIQQRINDLNKPQLEVATSLDLTMPTEENLAQKSDLQLQYETASNEINPNKITISTSEIQKIINKNQSIITANDQKILNNNDFDLENGVIKCYSNGDNLSLIFDTDGTVLYSKDSTSFDNIINRIETNDPGILTKQDVRAMQQGQVEKKGDIITYTYGSGRIGVKINATTGKIIYHHAPEAEYNPKLTQSTASKESPAVDKIAQKTSASNEVVIVGEQNKSENTKQETTQSINSSSKFQKPASQSSWDMISYDHVYEMLNKKLTPSEKLVNLKNEFLNDKQIFTDNNMKLDTITFIYNREIQKLEKSITPEPQPATQNQAQKDAQQEVINLTNETIQTIKDEPTLTSDQKIQELQYLISERSTGNVPNDPYNTMKIKLYEDAITELQAKSPTQILSHDIQALKNQSYVDASTYISKTFTILSKRGSLTAQSIKSAVMSIFKQSKTDLPTETQNSIAQAVADSAPAKNASQATWASWISGISKMMSDVIFGKQITAETPLPSITLTPEESAARLQEIQSKNPNQVTPMQRSLILNDQHPVTDAHNNTTYTEQTNSSYKWYTIVQEDGHILTTGFGGSRTEYIPVNDTMPASLRL